MLSGSESWENRIVPSDCTDCRLPDTIKLFEVARTVALTLLVSEMMENVTTPDQYELLEMSKISGFIDRARGTGRPTKKDRRSLEEFTAPEFMDDFDFDFDSFDKKFSDAKPAEAPKEEPKETPKPAPAKSKNMTVVA